MIVRLAAQGSAFLHVGEAGHSTALVQFAAYENLRKLHAAAYLRKSPFRGKLPAAVKVFAAAWFCNLNYYQGRLTPRAQSALNKKQPGW